MGDCNWNVRMAMRKFILENWSSKSNEEALTMALSVKEKGRTIKGDLIVNRSLNRNSIKFVVFNSSLT